MSTGAEMGPSRGKLEIRDLLLRKLAFQLSNRTSLTAKLLPLKEAISGSSPLGGFILMNLEVWSNGLI